MLTTLLTSVSRNVINLLRKLMASCVVQFTGDIALDGLLARPESHDKIRQTSEWLSQQIPEADLRIVNWEAPLEGNEGRHEMDKPIVGTSLEAAQSLLKFRIDVATIANNHVFDYMASGLKNTIDFLEASSIRTVGAGNTPEKAYQSLHVDVNGVPITILAYVGGDTHPPEEQSEMFVNMLEPEKVLRSVNKWSKRGRNVIVCLHWGVEYEAYPSPKRRSFAREIIETGAVIVACHHAHRLQGHEQWKHGHIFYGLGNFIFGLEHNECWPFFTAPTAVAYCSIDNGEAYGAGLAHLTQFVGAFDRPDSKTAEKMERTLNFPLKFSDRAYSIFWRLANIQHLIYEKPMEAFQRRGLKAIFKINRDHVKGLFKALSFGKLRRPGKKYR